MLLWVVFTGPTTKYSTAQHNSELPRLILQESELKWKATQAQEANLLVYAYKGQISEFQNGH